MRFLFPYFFRLDFTSQRLAGEAGEGTCACLQYSRIRDEKVVLFRQGKQKTDLDILDGEIDHLINDLTTDTGSTFYTATE